MNEQHQVCRIAGRALVAATLTSMFQTRHLANTALLLAAISLSSSGAMAQDVVDETFTTPAMTVDFCEVDAFGRVSVGGKVGPDSKLGQPVFVSRGRMQLQPTDVNNDGTYEGTTGASSLRAGDVVTVSIRPKHGHGANLIQCTLLPPRS